MAKKTVNGSCHCKKVTFSAQVDFSQGTGKCNCTFCTKNRIWSVGAKPEEFQLSTGKKSLLSNHSGSHQAFDFGRKFEKYESEHAFCGICGTFLFGRGNIPEIGGEYVTVLVTVLDGVNFEEIMKSPVHFMDGAADKWERKPEFTQHL